MNNFIYLGTTADNCEIYCTERKFSQLKEDQKQMLSEILPKYMYNDFPIIYTFSFDRLIGSTSLVEVEDYQKERVFWVYRKSNYGWRVPVLINGASRMTTYFTLLFDKKADKICLVDCYFGKRCLPLPSNPNAKKRGSAYVKECHEFWQNHALAMHQDDIDIDRTLSKMTAEDANRFLKCISG